MKKRERAEDGEQKASKQGFVWPEQAFGFIPQPYGHLLVRNKVNILG